MSVHNVRLLRYACQKNTHLPHVNSAFFDFASLASEHSDPDTDFIDELYLEIPEWLVAKVNRVVPGDLKPPMKAYLWALQNQNITAVISNLWDETYIRENLSLAGKKVELQMG